MIRLTRTVAIISLSAAFAVTGCNKEDANKAEGAAKAGASKAAAAGKKAAGAAKAGAAKAKAAVAAAAPAPATADKAMTVMMDGIKASKPVAAWDFLPASYQKDVTGLVHEVGGQLDAEMYDKVMIVVGKATKVLKEKKDFILNSKLTAQALAGAPVPKEVISKNWDAVVGMLNTLATSELKTAAGVKGLDVRTFLAGTGAKLMTDGLNVAKAMGQDPMKEMAGFKAEMVKTEGDKATVKLTPPGGGTAKDQEFAKVEGKWIPADMSKEWKEEIAKAKKELGALPAQMKQAKPMVMPILAKVETAVDKLGGAKNQAEFDGIIVGLMAEMKPGAPK